MSKKYLQNKTPKSSKYATTPATPSMSDSDESTKSTASDTNSSEDLSILALYDDLMRLRKQQRCDEVEDKFIDFVEQVKCCYLNWQTTADECKRLQMELAKITHDYSELECSVGHARRMLDHEKKRYQNLEKERDYLERKVNRAAHILSNTQSHLPDNALIKELAFLRQEDLTEVEHNNASPRLSVIKEVNSTGSILSDYSYSRSEDDLDSSAVYYSKFSNAINPNKRSTEHTNQPTAKKRRSVSNKVVEINTADTVRATTTLTVSKDGPITATSVIESVPPQSNKVSHGPQPSAPPAHLVDNLWNNNKKTTTNVRQHSFQNKMLVMPETCGSCNKRVGFGKTVAKCSNCRLICHLNCINLLPLPCVPVVNTPQKGVMGTIGDYTPTSPPMVPSLIIHCTQEIESRGHNELGLYRIPGSERDVKALKEKFLKGKASPCISNIDISVICGTVKDFLRSLQEPLVTYSRWADFVKAVEAPDKNDVVPVLNQLIAELPQPNRDTLAYMILHLKRVADMPKTKMPIDNLAKVFAPTIVGYSSNDIGPSMLLKETVQQYTVMEHLTNLDTDFWESFLESNDIFKTPVGKLQQTPSTDSLLYPKSRGLFSPYRVKSTVKRKQTFFPTP